MHLGIASRGGSAGGNHGTPGAPAYVDEPVRFREVTVAVIRITDTSTRPEIARAITVLRSRQLACRLEATRAEVQVEIDALLERWLLAPA